MRNPVAQAIRQSAQRYGVDPAAALAVATAEGGIRYGAVGDQGSSFGPFQLHRGGALGSHSAEWANSPAGIDFAVRSMAQSGARGRHGRGAVEAIVRNFERPAAPGPEIDRAFARYGEFGQSMPGMAPHPHAVHQAARAVAEAPPEVVQLAYHILSQGGLKLPPLQSFLPPATTVGSVSSANPRAATPPAPAAGSARLLAPAQGKIIGRPYQGTHRLYGNWESDNAVDIALPIGTPIRAVADGTIGSQFGSLHEGGNLAGLRLHLETAGNEFYYQHLSSFAQGIHPGSHVVKGQIIGYSGEANGVGHLHFAVKHGHPLGIR